MEMDRLKDLTDGSAESMRELVELFFKQTAQQLEQLEALDPLAQLEALVQLVRLEVLALTLFILRIFGLIQ